MNGFIRRCDAVFIAFCFWVHACNSGASQQLVYSAEQIPSLPLVSRDDLPSFGTYWLLVGPANGRLTPPLPCPPGDMPDAPIYALGDGKFLVDDSAVDYQAKREQQAASELVQAIFGLDQAEDSQMRLYTSEELWLELACVTNGAVSFVLHPPDVELQSGVYDLFQTTNLTTLVDGLNATNWVCIARTSPGVTNISVPTMTPDASYFRLAYTNDTDSDGLTDAFEALSSHSDPIAADTDGDGMPDGWEWRNFGSFVQTDVGDYDGDGASNLEEYLGATDPNTISFRVSVNSLYVNEPNVAPIVEMFGGRPSYQTLLVNPTNFPTCQWQLYSTNTLDAQLPAVDGAHRLVVGLKA